MAWSKKQKGVVIGGVAVLAAIAVVGGVTLTRINEAPRADAVTAEEQAADASSFDLTTQNAATRPRLDAVPQAVEELQSSGFTPIEEGKLTVAVTVSNAPLGATASDDNSVPIGLGPDIGQLVADGLGLEYNPVIVSWDDWPLGIQSGKYDVITSNVTVTEERKELYDFASWRKDLLGFYVKADSPITKIDSRDDISGLKIIVGSGTNQEQILLNWNSELEAAGKEPAELQYYEDQASQNLALASGRADATLGPNVSAAYNSAITGETKLVGTLDGGYPETAPIAVATKKGNNLITPVHTVLNEAIADGSYNEVLDRWGAGSEAITESEINPPGLPKTD